MRGEKRKAIKGSFTIEAAVIVPLCLTVFAVVLHLLFYYHDKNILTSVAYETAAYGAGRQEVSESELESRFATRIRDKLFLFKGVQSEGVIREDQVQVTVRAWKNSFSLKVASTIGRTEPEDYIRSLRKAKKIQEGIGNIE